MRRLIALTLLALPLPALAAECGPWSAAMQEDEGGPVMTADVCVPVGKGTTSLLVTCAEAGHLSARLMSMDTGGFVPTEPQFNTELQFAVGADVFALPAHYEEMDGAMVVDIDRASPLFALLQSGDKLAITDKAGKIAAVTLPLSHSKAALAKLTATCEK